MAIALNSDGSRVLIAAGRVPPKRKAARRCSQGNHWGRLINTERYADAGGMWTGMGECSVCGSTISRSQLRGAE